MKFLKTISIGYMVIFGVFLLGTAAHAQNKPEEFNGEIISFNGPGLRTARFTLRIKSFTTDGQANQNLAVLRDKGQDSLLNLVSKEDVGTLSIGSGLSQKVNVARQSQVGGKTRIFAVFQRWMHFSEIRGGYRSLDYPFGVIELMIDPLTGKGEGTYIAAAKITWNKDQTSGQDHVEIENFATYPARLLNVRVKPAGRLSS